MSDQRTAVLDSLSESVSSQHRRSTDRVAELTKKLDGLEDEAEGAAADHIAAARDQCREYLDGMDDDR